MKKIFRIIDKHLFLSLFGLRAKIKVPTKKPEVAQIKEYSLNKEERNPKIIASLTSFPQRINIVVDVIKSLMAQTLKPDKICLFLSDEQFKNKEQDLPENLLNLREYGLEIVWCEDIRSYKKLIPALLKFPNDIIITFDDDIYYAKDTIETLYNAHLKNPDTICANRASRIYLQDNEIKGLKLYEQIDEDYSAPSYFNRLTGCGGVLYPPCSLNQEVLNLEKIKKLIPTHDDVWFWIMAVLNHTKISIVKGFSQSLYTIENSQKFGLCKQNNSKTGLSVNDAYKIMVREYPKILEILKEEKCD